MPQGPEDIAREKIDRMLEQAGWVVQDFGQANIYACKGVALREFELKSGYGAPRITCSMSTERQRE
jgi:type I restriction enzyme R subunit